MVLLYAMLFKYAFVVLEDSANGEPEPPRLSWDVLGGEYELLVKYLGMWLLFILVLVSAAGRLGEWLSMALLYLGMALLPAVTMVLVQSRRFFVAINPVVIVAMIGRIGWSYLVLLVFWSLLAAGQDWVLSGVGSLTNTYVLLLVFFAVATWFTVINFHMMGYILLQAHERLGADTPVALRPDEAQQRLSVFDDFMQQGKTDAAIAELESLLKETPRDLGLHRRMHNLLLASQKADQLASHTSRVLPFLLETRQADVAAGFYIDCVSLSDDCAPRRADCYGRLAEALRYRGDSRRAALLVNVFNRQFAADEPSKPQFYLDIAHILAEDLNQLDQARRLLEVVAKTFPADPLLPELQAYMATLRALSV
jgi:tetratricopeptide (TPR) repeat protein